MLGHLCTSKRVRGLMFVYTHTHSLPRNHVDLASLGRVISISAVVQATCCEGCPSHPRRSWRDMGTALDTVAPESWAVVHIVT